MVRKILQEKQWIIIALCVAVMLGGLWFGLQPKTAKPNKPATEHLIANPSVVAASPACVTKKINLTVSGHSMSGLVEDGEQLQAQFGYYDCMPVKRHDWVLYRFGNQRSYVKIVRGLYPDSFSLKASNHQPRHEAQGWQIEVNKTLLTNSKGQPFFLEAHKGKQLRDEVALFQGKVPRGKFLIMGNLTEGTHDSSWYGLVNRDQLLAKISIAN